ncbi:UNVERIFIED_ORG: hypothetical protein J2W66_000335 [Agrobacterium larrymoorei]|nr:hypothetical protein [Agrobacterium larrymoorei]
MPSACADHWRQRHSPFRCRTTVPALRRARAPRVSPRQKQQKRPGRIRTDLLSLVICRQYIRGQRASDGAATPLGEENAGRRVWFQVLIE